MRLMAVKMGPSYLLKKEDGGLTMRERRRGNPARPAFGGGVGLQRAGKCSEHPQKVPEFHGSRWRRSPEGLDQSTSGRTRWKNSR